MTKAKIRRETNSGLVPHSKPKQGRPVRIGAGFEALSFSHTQFHGLMDPLVMVDHFIMTAPTFGTHPHAGMSAVSLLFEDSEGRFRNRDSLGNEVDLLPGDLYWLTAGCGVVHNEMPLSGARTHALQIFVNLPARMKHVEPSSLHVPNATIPVVEGEGHRVRVVLGETHGLIGASSPALPLTVLDVQLDAGSSFTHAITLNDSVWLHSIRGNAGIRINGQATLLREHEAIALRGTRQAELEIHSRARSQVVLMQGTPIEERFIQRGPFVMSTLDEIEAVAAAYSAGRLGSID